MLKGFVGLCFLITSLITAALFYFQLELPVPAVISFVGINAISGLIITSMKSGKKSKKLLAKLDQQVKAYFQSNDQLKINDAVLLQVKKAGYNTYEDLDVYYNEELICKFGEFEQYFPESYQSFLNKLEAKSYLMQPPVSEKVVEEIKEDDENENIIVISGFIKTIESYNIDITDEVISQGLYSSVALLKQLVLLQEKYPKTNRKLTKLTSHYLPILTEILKNYTTVSSTHADRNEVDDMREKLNKTIILINEAIKNITSSLFQEEMMNLSADMTVLENILKSDGLIEDEMTMEQLNKIVE